MHNYYAQLIYYTDVNKCCESLTDWSIPLTSASNLSLVADFNMAGSSALCEVAGVFGSDQRDDSNEFIVAVTNSLPMTRLSCQTKNTNNVKIIIYMTSY